ncbi:MAG: PHP-associated domain-containing protein [Methanocorpusculum sp.]|nr:PHP-associated domain-containing protein [Methanocorpusculum sp.]
MSVNIIHAPFKKSDEKKAFDMHVHTTSSDGLASAKTQAKLADKYDYSIAVTDHNVIAGAKKALEFSKNILPAIEISALEGPHLLIYFDKFAELRSYYEESVKDYLTFCPNMAVKLSTEKIVECAKNAGGFVVAAHPYGYGVSVRGVMKGINTGLISSEVAEELDGLEVICSGLSDKKNMLAESYSKKYNKCMTGGSDAHVLWEVTRAVNVGFENETPQELLENVRRRRSDVCGVGRTPAQNILMGACMTPRYLPYAVPVTVTHVKQTYMRVKHKSG